MTKYFATFKNKKFTGLHTQIPPINIQKESDEIVEVTLANLQREIQRRENPSQFDEWLEILEKFDLDVIEKKFRTKSEEMINQFDELSRFAQQKIGEKLRFIADLCDSNTPSPEPNQKLIITEYVSPKFNSLNARIINYRTSRKPILKGTLRGSVQANNKLIQEFSFNEKGEFVNASDKIMILNGAISTETGDFALFWNISPEIHEVAVEYELIRKN